MKVCFRDGMLAAICVTLLAGCSKSRFPPTARVTGTVTVDGKPMQRLAVSFRYQGKAARHGSGITDAEGKFVISTFGKEDGALLGTHNVTITDTPEPVKISDELMAKSQEDPTVLYDIPGGMTGRPLKFTRRIPKKYSDQESSRLEVTVTDDGPNEYVFPLEN